MPGNKVTADVEVFFSANRSISAFTAFLKPSVCDPA
jgi:hypothetical protein